MFGGSHITLRRALLGIALVLLAVCVRAQVTVTWGGGNSNWATSGSWKDTSGNVVSTIPGASDNAQVTTGTVTISDSRSATSFGISGGTLTLTGSLTTSGAASFTSGVVAGSGTLTIGGLLTLSGTSLTGTGAINANGGASMTNDFTFNNQTLVLGANSSWSGAYIRGGQGSVLTNNAGQTLTTNFDGIFNGNYYSGTTSVFNNNGTFTKTSATSGVTDISAVFNNSGAVNVQGGTLQLDSGGTHTGTASISSGATLNLNGGTHSFSSAASITGAGTLRVGGGTANFGGNNVSPSAITISGGTANFTATTNSSGSTFATTNLTVNGGTLTFAGTGAVSGTSTLSSGVVNGSGTLNLTGLATLSGASLIGTGTINANGGASLTNDFTFNNQTLVLGANSSWSGAYIRGGQGSVLTNNAGQTLTTNFDGIFNGNYYSGTTSVFNNNGTFTKTSATSGTTDISAVFNNSGAVNVQGGTLQLDSGGTHTGTASISSGAMLNLNGGVHSFSSAASITGAGTLRVGGGTANFGGNNVSPTAITVSGGTANFTATTNSSGSTFATTNLTVNGGTLTFAGTGAVSGTSTLSSGVVNGSGTLNLTGLATLSGASLIGTGTVYANGGASLTNDFTFNNQTLVLGANSSWSGAYIRGGQGSVLTNNAGQTLTTNFDGIFNGNYYSGTTSVFNNNGTFTKTSATSGTTDISAVFNNTGAVNVQGGTLQLDSGGTHTGTASISSGATLNLNGGTHNFSSAASITGSGTLRVGGGTANFSGDNVSLTAITVSGGTANFTATTNSSGSTFATTNLTVNGGTLTFAGTGAVSGTSTLSSGVVNGSGTLNLTGLATLSGASLVGTGTINANGGASLTNDFTFNNQTLVLAANSTWSGAYIRGGQGSILTNNSSQTFTTNFDGIFNGNYYGGITSVFNNNGTFTKTSATSGVTDISAVFNNSGAVNVQGGTLQLDSGGTHTGTASISSGATLNLNGGTHSFSSAASITGSGALRVGGGTANFGGNNVSPSAITISGGTANFTATTNSSGSTFATTNLTVNGGTLTFAGTGAVSGTSTLSSGVVNGSGTLNLTGLATLSGASLIGTGTINANGGASLTNDFTFNNQTLVLGANSTWSGAYIRGGQGSTLTNNAGQTLTTNFDGIFNGNYYSGTTSVFNNNGTFTKTNATSGTTDISAVFNNAGTINVQGGTVQLDSGGSATSASGINVAAGATLKFNGGTFALDNGASLSGGGTVLVNGGTVTVATGTVAMPNLSVASGKLAGAGSANIASFTQTGGSVAISDLQLAGAITWSGGDWDSTLAATATLAIGSTLTFNSGNNHAFDFRSITNNGTITWVNGHLGGGDGSVFTNAGTFNDQTNNYQFLGPGSFGFGAGSTFVNTGTYVRDGVNATYFQVPFNNNGTGIVQLKNGDLHFNGGGSVAATASIGAASGTSVYFDNGFTVANGASLTGLNGTTGNYYLTNGTLNLSGTLNVPNFTQNGGTLGGTQTIAGAYAWNNGNWNATSAGAITTIDSTGTLTLGGGNNHTFDFRSITNNGTITWLNGQIGGGDGSVFTNNGTFNDQANGYQFLGPGSFGFGAGSSFTNTGTYIRNGGNATWFQIPFNNSGGGQVQVKAGDLRFEAGGSLSSNATIAAAAGTNVYFDSSFTVSNGASLTGLNGGSGNFLLTGGTFALSGRMNVTNFTQTGGTLSGTNVIAGSYSWNGGTWNDTAPGSSTTIDTGATLTLTAGASHTYDFRSVTNNGTVVWVNGHIGGGDGSVFTNNGTFNDQNNGYQFLGPGSFGFGGSASFTNTGTYLRNGTNSTLFQIPFNNTGTGQVQVAAGDLRFEAGGSLGSSASIAAAAGTNVYFDNGFTVPNGASLTGLNGGFGGFYLTGGTLALSGKLNVSNFTQTGGTLAGTNTLAGAYTWTGGTWNDTAAGASTTIDTGATLTLTNGANHTYDFRSVTNNGAVNWINGHIGGGDGSVFTNNGTFHDQNASSYQFLSPGSFGFGGAASFSNNGTYTRDVGGTTYFQVPFNNAGTLNLAANGTSGAVGDIQLNGGGTMSGTSIVNADSGTHLYFTNNYAISDGARFRGQGAFIQTNGTLSINGTLDATSFNWSGGNWNATSATAASANTVIGSTTSLILDSGANHVYDYRNITNNGTVTWINGHIGGGDGSVFTNNALFHDQNSASYQFYAPGNFGFGGTASFVNNGTYTRDVGGTTYFQVPFNNNGTLNLQANATTGALGDIQLNGDGTMGATSVVNAAAGTHLYFTNNYTIGDGARFSGAGSFVQTNGTLTINGTLNASSFNWSGGNWNATSATAASATTLIGSTTNLILDSGVNHVYDYRNITNNGTVTWINGHIGGGDGSVFTNNALFHDQNSASYQFYAPGNFGFSGAASFVNNGTYTRDVGGTTYFQVPFNNNGTLNLQANATTGALGDIQLNGGGTMGATSVVNGAAGTHLYFTNSYTLADGARFTGLGAFVQTNGTLTINGALTASSFNWSGGNWNAAVSATLPTTTISSGTNLILDGGANHTYDARNITNNGTVTWINGYIAGGDGSTFINAGTFSDQNASGYTFLPPSNFGFGGSSTFSNNPTGLYNKSTGGTTTFQVPFVNNGGTVVVAGGALRFSSTFQQNAGTLAVANGATMQFDQSGGLNLAAGYLVGNGTIVGSVSSSGVISPSAGSYSATATPGQLGIQGNLSLASVSSLLFEIGGNTAGTGGYDLLSVSGSATLGGAQLNVGLTNGFLPGASQTFTILTSAGLSGLFANVPNGQQLFTMDGLGKFTVNYGIGSAFAANSVVLSNFIPVPEPSTWVLLGLGGILVVGWIERRRRG